MIDEVKRLIDFIQAEYMKFHEMWKNNEYYLDINLKNNLVCDISNNLILLDLIFNYRKFIIQNNIYLLMKFKSFNTEKSKVNIRTKTRNSIEYKIKNYTENHNAGKIPISKCLNDLFRN